MFRLAETLHIADPREIENALPPALITDWYRYFDYKDKRFDKLEYYLVQLSALIAGIGGNTDTAALVWRREEREAAADGKRNKTSITADTALGLLAAAIGAK